MHSKDRNTEFGGSGWNKIDLAGAVTGKNHEKMRQTLSNHFFQAYLHIKNTSTAEGAVVEIVVVYSENCYCYGYGSCDQSRCTQNCINSHGEDEADVTVLA